MTEFSAICEVAPFEKATGFLTTEYTELEEFAERVDRAGDGIGGGLRRGAIVSEYYSPQSHEGHKDFLTTEYTEFGERTERDDWAGAGIFMLRRSGFRVHEMRALVATIWSRIGRLAFGDWNHQDTRDTKIFCRRVQRVWRVCRLG